GGWGRRRSRRRPPSTAPTRCWSSPITPSTPSSTCPRSSPRCARPPCCSTRGASSTRTPRAGPACGTPGSAMARVLVLGGAGFIGAHLATRLAGEGHALTLVDDLSRGRRDPTVDALLARPNVRLVQADLTRPGALDPLPRECDQVYMLAAVVGLRNVESDPARVVRVNTLSLLHLLDWMPGRGEVLFF